MSLQSLLDITRKKEAKDIEVTEEILEEHLDQLRQIIAYWRVYPDKFVDYLCSLNPNNTFHLFFYQRLFLRVVMRHKYVYATFVRAWSKSFMAVLAFIIKAILYPRAKLFTVAGGKEQSAGILSEKVDELCQLIPALEKEIVWDTRGTKAKTRQTKDSVVYTFKNGSELRNVAATEATRGKRFHSGIMEECVGIDQNMLEAVIVPTMNVSRMVNGQVDPNEKLNKAQVFITTAGYKNTFSYDKLIQVFCQMVARPKDSFVLGGTWRVPVKEGLLDKNFVQELKMDGTFNEATFEREYESHWTGDIESAFFNSDVFDRHRIIKMAEHKASSKIAKNGYYVMGVDVGRLDCATEVVIIKVTPSMGGSSIKQIVNIITFDEEHFGMQTLRLKRLYQLYKCKIAVVDGNGIGLGLVDLLTMDTTDPDTGDILYGWGVYNDDERQRYKDRETENTIPKAMYIMKANTPLNSEMYAYCKTQLINGKIKFLIDESTAKNKLLSQEQGKKMSQLQRARYLMPYTETNILKDQMMNLIEEHEGTNIILKRSNRKIKQDKFSALIYGLYFCKIDEDLRKKRKRRNISDFMFFN